MAPCRKLLLLIITAFVIEEESMRAAEIGTLAQSVRLTDIVVATRVDTFRVQATFPPLTPLLTAAVIWC